MEGLSQEKSQGNLKVTECSRYWWWRWSWSWLGHRYGHLHAHPSTELSLLKDKGAKTTGTFTKWQGKWKISENQQLRHRELTSAWKTRVAAMRNPVKVSSTAHSPVTPPLSHALPLASFTPLDICWGWEVDVTGWPLTVVPASSVHALWDLFPRSRIGDLLLSRQYMTKLKCHSQDNDVVHELCLPRRFVSRANQWPCGDTIWRSTTWRYLATVSRLWRTERQGPRGQLSGRMVV